MQFIKSVGVWKAVKALFIKQAGIWKPVRQGFIKSAGIWKQFYGNNMIEVYSFGLFETVYPYSSNGVWINGTHVYTLGASWAGWNTIRVNDGLPNTDTQPPATQTSDVIHRSYNLVTFDKYGNLDHLSQSFDVWNDGPGQGGAFNATAAALANGQIFAVICNDAIQPNSTYIADGITALGGTGSTFANGQVLSYSSYLLIGQKGSPAFFEQFVGGDPVGTDSVPSAANALSASYKKFTIIENALQEFS